MLPAAWQPRFAAAGDTPIAVGGELAVTSAYIYRGVAESDGHAAVQAELHADFEASYVGVWGSSRDRDLDPYADYDVELYLGHRFALNNAWGAAVTVRSHSFVGGPQDVSDDYQEITGSLSYLDCCALALTAIPNAVRYWYTARLGRSPAWATDLNGQWVAAGGFAVTGGAGYYYSSGTGPGIESATGYAYANVGVVFERQRWRFELGYFLAQNRAQELFPYPIARRVAGTVAWRF